MRLIASLLAGLAACASSAVNSVGTVEQSTTVCGGSATVHGMDVSAYETSIDWDIAKTAGIDFTFIRATDGTQYLDPKFASYWAGARAAGVIRGAYQFFRPAEDPIAQADLLLKTIGTLAADDLPPVIDVETTGGLAPAAVAAGVQAWVTHVEAMTGRTPIIYAGFYSWQDDVGGANLSTYPLWHAQYTTEACPNIPVPWTRRSFWQYSSTGSVPDVEGETTDLDVFDGTLDDLHAFVANGLAPCGVIAATGGTIDDGDPCFATGGPSTTLHDVTTAGDGGDLIWTHATAATTEGNFAQWDLELAEAGTYRVEVYTDTAFAQSKSAAYTVAAAGVTQTVRIDQTAVDGWQSLGEWAFAAGGHQFVHLGDDTGETGTGVQLVFDAVRLTRVDAPAAGNDAGTDAPGATRASGGCSAGGDPTAAAWLLLVLLTSRRAAGSARRRRASASPA